MCASNAATGAKERQVPAGFWFLTGESQLSP